MFNKRDLFFLLTAALLITGCSGDNDPAQPGDFAQQVSAVVRGEISRDMVDFEFVAELGKGIDDPVFGTLLVRGRNLAYDPELGALTVDISVFNNSESSLPEPVGMTFMQFIPDSVTILASDNDQNGSGALVMFEFDDGDGSWGPGEESRSRNVQFDVEAGTSIGFVARIDVGMAPGGGVIGGMVWNDVNEDGVIDPDEIGVGGVTMALIAGADSTGTPMATEVTADDGSYRFEGRDAGYYTVIRLRQDGLIGTTPPYMAVLLVEMNGTVSDFLVANFGVKKAGGGLGVIQGVVFNDLNGDGMMDEGEPGLEGVKVDLTGDATAATVSLPDGRFAFRGLMMGTYQVASTGPMGWVATTAESIQVILVADDGVFDQAVFGWMDDGSGGDFVQVGDYVDAKGDYQPDPDRLVALDFQVKQCDRYDDNYGPHHGDRDGDCDGDHGDGDCDGDCDGDHDGDHDGDCDGGCRQDGCWGRLAGPVTGLSAEDGYLEIMGTPVFFTMKDDRDFGDFEFGIRVRVEATRDEDVDGGRVVACRGPKYWKGHGDRIRGFVQEVVRGDDNRITGVIVLNTLIEVSTESDHD